MKNSIRQKGLLLSVEKAISLPEGKIKEEELLNIDNIYSDFQIRTATEIIIAVKDNKNIFTKADILERAYKYDWNKTEQPILTKTDQRKIYFSKIFKKYTQLFFQNIHCIIGITIVPTFLSLPFALTYLDYIHRQQLGQYFAEPEIWFNKCSSNGKYCLDISTEGKKVDHETYQLLKLRIKNTNNTVLYSSEYLSKDAFEYFTLSTSKKSVQQAKENFADIWAGSDNSYFVSNQGHLITILLDDNRMPLTITHVSNHGKKIIEYNKKDLNKLIGTDKKNIDQVLNKNFYQIAKPVQITNNLVKLDLISINLFVNLENGQISKEKLF